MPSSWQQNRTTDIVVNRVAIQKDAIVSLASAYDMVSWTIDRDTERQALLQELHLKSSSDHCASPCNASLHDIPIGSGVVPKYQDRWTTKVNPKAPARACIRIEDDRFQKTSFEMRLRRCRSPRSRTKWILDRCPRRSLRQRIDRPQYGPRHWDLPRRQERGAPGTCWNSPRAELARRRTKLRRQSTRIQTRSDTDHLSAET